MPLATDEQTQWDSTGRSSASGSLAWRRPVRSRWRDGRASSQSGVVRVAATTDPGVASLRYLLSHHDHCEDDKRGDAQDRHAVPSSTLGTADPRRWRLRGIASRPAHAKR